MNKNSRNESFLKWNLLGRWLSVPFAESDFQLSVRRDQRCDLVRCSQHVKVINQRSSCYKCVCTVENHCQPWISAISLRKKFLIDKLKSIRAPQKLSPIGLEAELSHQQSADIEFHTRIPALDSIALGPSDTIAGWSRRVSDRLKRLSERSMVERLLLLAVYSGKYKIIINTGNLRWIEANNTIQFFRLITLWKSWLCHNEREKRRTAKKKKSIFHVISRWLFFVILNKLITFRFSLFYIETHFCQSVRSAEGSMIKVGQANGEFEMSILTKLTDSLTFMILGSRLPEPSLAPVPGVARLQNPAVTQMHTPTVLLLIMNPFCGPARASADFSGNLRTSPDDDDDKWSAITRPLDFGDLTKLDTKTWRLYEIAISAQRER